MDKIQFVISFIDPNLDDEDKESETQKLLSQLRNIEEVDRVERISDTNPPKRNKAIGGFLPGILLAEITIENIKTWLAFLNDRLSGKTIELKVQANGKTLEVKASSRAELETAIRLAEEFVMA
ncbi:MAG: hypothetical protein J7641_07645 [Cyanobacteria bacterium SID2]|nr:hypothetical protein [Cyanobacteria bacterium SID2]MBP0005460.1 hypothetical protein [Cyanobacteria bacterium SBC]